MLMAYTSERPHDSLNNLTPEECWLMAENPEYQKVRGAKTIVLTVELVSSAFNIISINRT